MKTARPYRMQARAAAAEATRERILEAALDLILARWYDEVTLAAVAGGAGVSTHTVCNHLVHKEALAAAAMVALSQRITAQRDVAPGDVAGAVAALADDYDVTGDAIVRILALEGRVPS